MYHQVWQSKFKDIIDLSEGKFVVENSEAARKQLALHINDNVYKNLSNFSVKLFDSDLKLHKRQFTNQEQVQIVEDLINDHDLKKQLMDAVDRILIAHRNTKLFLFLMSGPFFLFFSLIKYSLKITIMYFLYKKG